MTNIVQLRPRPAQLRCSQCHATAEAACDCGVAYVPAGELATLAIEANPEMSDRAIAEQIGVSHPTVAKARKATGKDLPVGRIGRDGKRRKKPRAKAAAERIKLQLKAAQLPTFRPSKMSRPRSDMTPLQVRCNAIYYRLSDMRAEMKSLIALVASEHLDAHCKRSLMGVLEDVGITAHKLGQGLDGR